MSIFLNIIFFLQLFIETYFVYLCESKFVSFGVKVNINDIN